MRRFISAPVSEYVSVMFCIAVILCFLRIWFTS